jgi:hypothetical protein
MMTPSPIRLALFALLALPILVLAGWFISEGLPRWMPPTPPWLTATNPAAVPASCDAVASLNAYHASFTNDTAGVTISAEESRNRTDELVAAQYGLPDGHYAVEQGPALVRGTFPNVGERLAWLNVALLENNVEARLGKAAVVYVDAETGEPLAILTAAAVENPMTACGPAPMSRRDLLRRYLPLLLMGGYLALVMAGVGIRYIVGRRRLTQRRRDTEKIM